MALSVQDAEGIAMGVPNSGTCATLRRRFRDCTFEGLSPRVRRSTMTRTGQGTVCLVRSDYEKHKERLDAQQCKDGKGDSIMSRTAAIVVLAGIGLCVSAGALTGSGDSPVGALETVRPTLDSISVPTEASIEATFSEPMLAPGASTAGNYAVSGLGAGTLGANPDSVSGTGPYTLTWTTGEMQDGQTVTLTATSVQDAVGNPIDTSANSASAPGVGVAPIFTGLIADPGQASAGETVSISFSSSEELDGDPIVTVNGNAATFVSGTKATSFTYEYLVLHADPLGAAAIAISGSDLAGNLGSLSDSAALEIVEPEPELPLRWFPAALALLLAGMTVLALQRRVDAASSRISGKRQDAASTFTRLFLLLTLVLFAPMAVAQGPAVSSVAFVQQDNGAGGTEVVITYDLDAPNGPCDITVSLSKDGGLDGFIHTVTSVTGDLTGVTTGTDYSITWDIAADYPDEDIPNAQLRVTADDGLALFSLTYTAGSNGSISGDSPQSVVEGNDGTPVTAVADPDYHFVDWSDGVLTATRQDTNVTGDITVTASFAPFQPEMIPVAAGAFDMGNSGVGDDLTYARAMELPMHSVALSAYEIGKYAVTNQQVCGVFNWANAQGYFTTVDATTATAYGQELLDLDDAECYIEYAGGVFSPETRTGLPGTTTYSMADHPVLEISWYGAVAYCNWLSEILGLTPVYNTTTWEADFANDGFHPPKEAQWERAAAWDGSKHWIYGCTSDTLTGDDQANYGDEVADFVNPLGLTTTPYTSPVGWFDGVNVSPNGSVATVDSPSPVGCYDMCGNVWEWCHDWMDGNYYTTGGPPWVDPTGPATGTERTARGGGWYYLFHKQRSCWRSNALPTLTSTSTGFRVARDTGPKVVDFAINGGDASTVDPEVTLDNTCSSAPTEYMASEASDFSGATWETYDTAPSFTLSGGSGTKTVYFKVRNAAGESAPVSDTILVAGAPSPGDIVVCEIMKNPAAVSEGDGEWFEVYNVTAGDIDIDGWTLLDLGTDVHVIDNGGPLIVPAGGYLVLGNNADSGTNGGVTVNYSYGAALTFSNTDDEIVLQDATAAEIDRVVYDTVTFPDPNGASMALYTASMDSAANDVGSNWFVSYTPLPGGDFGTPGSVNEE